MMTFAAPAFVPQAIPTVSDALRDLLRGVRIAVPDAVIVGGALRDALAGREPHDIDIVTFGDARGAAEAISRRFEAPCFALDDERGQFRITRGESHAIRDIDVSRIDDLDADLARRDFTVDAMAAPVLEDGSLGEVIDPFGGLRDLEAARLRMVTASNLEDDPLRLLRAVRLATELEMSIEPATEAVIRHLAPRLAESAGERQREEIVRILDSPRAFAGMQLADTLGLLDVFLPELAPARGVEQPTNHHYYDVFEHSMQALAAMDEMLHDIPSNTERPWLGPEFRGVMQDFDLQTYVGEHAGGHTIRVLLKLSALLHDVSKPETRALHDDGRIRFLGHPEKGAVKAEQVCHRLRFSNRETRFVSLLVEEHLRPTQLAPAGVAPSRRALYRFFRDLGNAAPACLILSLADAAAATGPRLQRERWQAHVRYAYWVLYQGSQILRPSDAGPKRILTGRDLMSELGMEPGPALGEILASLDEAQALGDITTREEALAFAKIMITPPPAPSPNSERGEHEAEQQNTRRWQADAHLWDGLRTRAREMRHEPTEAEAMLWQALRRNQLDGLAFRRQHAIDRFIVDFYCPAEKLAIEVDGGIHESQRAEDELRREAIEARDIRLVRLSNEEVLSNLGQALDRIREAVSDKSDRTPSPNSGRGQGEGSS